MDKEFNTGNTINDELDSLGANVEKLINDSNWEVENVTTFFADYAQNAAKSLNVLTNLSAGTERVLNKTSDNLEERVMELENRLKEIQTTLKEEVINISTANKAMIDSYTAALYISNTNINNYENMIESYQAYINDDENHSTEKGFTNINTLVNDMTIEIKCPISDSYSDLENRLMDEIRRQG